ncbi:hypothetical protein AURDEDRAFT_165514 [Auricularia subglabra TFB-10046 SS5]|nr:hypothetical protein AURDEDRAFT_165514 [Auricularia subglabra TFB-10046 SS5]
MNFARSKLASTSTKHAFGDIPLNKNTHNRNVYQYSLHAGVLIDDYDHGRNIRFAL